MTLAIDTDAYYVEPCLSASYSPFVQLIKRYQQGEVEVFTEIHDHLLPLVTDQVSRHYYISHGVMDRDELMSIAWYAVMKGLQRYDCDRFPDGQAHAFFITAIKTDVIRTLEDSKDSLVRYPRQYLRLAKYLYSSGPMMPTPALLDSLAKDFPGVPVSDMQRLCLQQFALMRPVLVGFEYHGAFSGHLVVSDHDVPDSIISRQIIKELLASLTTFERDVLVARWIEGNSRPAVSEILDVPVNRIVTAEKSITAKATAIRERFL